MTEKTLKRAKEIEVMISKLMTVQGALRRKLYFELNFAEVEVLREPFLQIVNTEIQKLKGEMEAL